MANLQERTGQNIPPDGTWVSIYRGEFANQPRLQIGKESKGSMAMRNEKLHVLDTICISQFNFDG